MLRHLPLAVAALAGLAASPAHAWDPARAGRYGPLDLDSLDVGGRVKARGGLTVGGPTSLSDILSLGDDKPAILELYKSQPKNLVMATPGGARISIESLGGHAPGDSFRTQFAVQTRSQASAATEESSTLFEMDGVTGYSRPWAPSTAFAASTDVTGGDGSMFINVAPCTSGAGPIPSGNGTYNVPNQSDGGCTWRYVGIGAGNNKHAMNVVTLIKGPANGLPGGGGGWAAAFQLGVKPGAWPHGGGFGTGIEIDVGNEMRHCPVAVVNGCNLTGIFLNGNGLFKSSIGMDLGGTVGFYRGLLLRPTFASDVGITNSTSSSTGYLDDGTHTIAAYQDISTSPYGMRLAGNYAVGALQHKDFLLGKWGGDSTYSAISFNNNLGNGSMLGLFGKAGDSSLYARVPAAGTIRIGIGGAEPVIITATGMQLPALPISGSAAGTLCLDTNNAVFVKKTPGACL